MRHYFKTCCAWLVVGCWLAGGSSLLASTLISVTIINSTGSNAVVTFYDCSGNFVNSYPNGTTVVNGAFVSCGTGTIGAVSTTGAAQTCVPTTYSVSGSTASVSVAVSNPGGGGGGGGGTTTNTNCLTLSNTGNQPQYYRFVNGGAAPGNAQYMSGCSSSLSVGGVNGPDTGNDPSDYMAVYPGESVTVCSVVLNDSTYFLQAFQAPTDGSVYPCGLVAGSPRCVQLCTGDNVPYAGANDTAGPMTPFGSGTNNAYGGTTNGVGTGFGVVTNGAGFPTYGTNQLTNDEVGDDAIVNAINKASALNNLDLGTVNSTLDDAIQSDITNTARITNALNNLSNSFSGLSNVFGTNLSALSNLAGLNNLTNIPTNYPDAAAISNTSGIWGALTNFFGGLFASTNTASNGVVGAVGTMGTNGTNLGTSVSGGWSNLASGGAFIQPTTNNGVGGYQIAVANDYEGAPLVMDISESFVTSTEQTWFNLGKGVGAWVVTLLAFLAILDESKHMIDQLYGQRQIVGNSQEVFGNSAALPSGLIYAGIFASIIGALPVAIVAFCTTFNLSSSVVGGLSGAYTAVTASPMWTLVTLWCPVATVVSAFFSWALFKYFYGPILLVVARSVLLMMLACVVFGLFVWSPSSAEAFTVNNSTPCWVAGTLFYYNTNSLTSRASGPVWFAPFTVEDFASTNFQSIMFNSFYTNALGQGTFGSVSPSSTILYTSFDPPVTFLLTGTTASVGVSSVWGYNYSAWFLDGFYGAGLMAALWGTIWAYKKGIAPQTDFRA